MTKDERRAIRLAQQKYPSELRVSPQLVPCDHFWLEVKTKGVVTAVCKFRGCQKKYVFTMEEWGALAQAGRALNKPVRV